MILRSVSSCSSSEDLDCLRPISLITSARPKTSPSENASSSFKTLHAVLGLNVFSMYVFSSSMYGFSAAMYGFCVIIYGFPVSLKAPLMCSFLLRNGCFSCSSRFRKKKIRDDGWGDVEIHILTFRFDATT